MILTTGGAGFIGSNFVLEWMATHNEAVVNLDKLTYAGNLGNLQALEGDNRHTFIHGDIGDVPLVADVLRQHQPRAIINFAAETHVDRSIHGPASFVDSNVVGLANLLGTMKEYWEELSKERQASFRFLQISTDEVYGSLTPTAPPFTEATAYEPNSPYSATKAAGDHLVRAYHQTYGIPVLTTNCSNNYGPFQFPEKLIPLMIANALDAKQLPIYGDGQQIRDWLYVKDHCQAIATVLDAGRPGEVYNIGGNSELTNRQVVDVVCELLDELHPASSGNSYNRLITFVADRPGHDRRYAIDAGKIQRDLGWTPKESFDTGMRKTVQWYLDNAPWVANVRSGEYRQWLSTNYAERG